MASKLVTCNKCGTVYTGKSVETARTEILKFNTFYNSLSKEKQQEMYGGKRAYLLLYTRCWCGNSYKKFRDFSEGDCPDGVTLDSILHYDETLPDSKSVLKREAIQRS